MPDDAPAVPLQRLGYQPGLDGFRGILVLTVVAVHEEIPHTFGGRIVVYLFFILSGFLITRLLLDEQANLGQLSIRRFYARRALRLLPALFVVVVATTIYALANPHSPGSAQTVGSLPPALFYYANWVIYAHAQHAMGLFNHFWTLSVEEQFYFVWPAVLAVIGKRRAALLSMIGGLIVLGLLTRIRTWHGISTDHLLEGTDEVVDALAFGALVAYATITWHERTTAVCRAMFWPAAAFVLFAGAWFDLHLLTDGSAFLPYEVTIVCASGAVIVGRIATDRRSAAARVLGWRPVAYMGQISYGIYLWHVLAIDLVFVKWGWHNQVRGDIAVYAVTLVLASLSWHFVERPFLRRKRTLEPVSTEPDPALSSR